MSERRRLPLAGAIPRVERQESHHRFLWAVRPPVAMIGLVHAARVAMHDEPFFPPETDVVLTSTIRDAKLAEYSFEDELRIIRAIKPRWVLPFDFPVYGDMNAEKRESYVRQVAAGAIDMQRIVNELPDEEITRICDVKDLPRELVEPVQNTTVIPMLKGTTPHERNIMFQVANELDAPIVSKYGVQYMTVGGNGNHPQLCRDLETIAEETNEFPTMVIGLLSPSGKYSLEGVPDNVVAAAGTNQWVKRVQPKSSSPKEMREAFETFYNNVSETLGVEAKYYASIAAGTPDKPANASFTKTPGNAVGNNLQPSIAGAAKDGEYGFGQRKRPPDAMGPAAAGRLSKPPQTTTHETNTDTTEQSPVKPKTTVTTSQTKLSSETSKQHGSDD